MLPAIPLALLIGSLFSAYTLGTKAARPIASLLKPVLLAATPNT